MGSEFSRYQPGKVNFQNDSFERLATQFLPWRKSAVKWSVSGRSCWHCARNWCILDKRCVEMSSSWVEDFATLAVAYWLEDCGKHVWEPCLRVLALFFCSICWALFSNSTMQCWKLSEQFLWSAVVAQALSKGPKSEAEMNSTDSESQCSMNSLNRGGIMLNLAAAKVKRQLAWFPWCKTHLSFVPSLAIVLHWPFSDSSHLHSFAVLELLDGMQYHWSVWTLFFNDNIPYRWYIEYVWPRDESCLHTKKSKAGWWKRELADVCWKSFSCTGSFVGWTRQKFPPDDVLSVETRWNLDELCQNITLSIIILYNRLYIENVFAFDWCFDSFARSLFNTKTHGWASRSSKLLKTLLECQPMPRRPDLAQVVAPGAFFFSFADSPNNSELDHVLVRWRVRDPYHLTNTRTARTDHLK